jgi:hypothetical protein
MACQIFYTFRVFLHFFGNTNLIERKIDKRIVMSFNKVEICNVDILKPPSEREGDRRAVEGANEY